MEHLGLPFYGLPICLFKLPQAISCPKTNIMVFQKTFGFFEQPKPSDPKTPLGFWMHSFGLPGK